MVLDPSPGTHSSEAWEEEAIWQQCVVADRLRPAPGNKGHTPATHLSSTKRHLLRSHPLQWRHPGDHTLHIGPGGILRSKLQQGRGTPRQSCVHIAHRKTGAWLGRSQLSPTWSHSTSFLLMLLLFTYKDTVFHFRENTEGSLPREKRSPLPPLPRTATHRPREPTPTLRRPPGPHPLPPHLLSVG